MIFAQWWVYERDVDYIPLDEQINVLNKYVKCAFDLLMKIDKAFFKLVPAFFFLGLVCLFTRLATAERCVFNSRSFIFKIQFPRTRV